MLPHPFYPRWHKNEHGSRLSMFDGSSTLQVDLPILKMEQVCYHNGCEEQGYV